ncbi:MAG: sigma-70 family RNA polymerase sigma factor [Verrucomicrobiales bacterium]|nr:sigma-70 family RNA polymerase sigma factor [Verrucomicrobiales bacterium]
MEAIEQRPDLERLFKESAEDLARYFSRRHDSGEKAQDLVQETFLKMARRLETGNAPVHLRAYLFGIARHVSHAAWKRTIYERKVRIDYPDDLTAAAEPDERVRAATEVIEGLPELQREILDLRFSQGFSYAEMAEALEIPIGTVRSRLHNAIALVRDHLRENNPE